MTSLIASEKFSLRSTNSMKHVNIIMSTLCFMISMAFVAFFLYILIEKHKFNPALLLYIYGGIFASREFSRRARGNTNESRKEQ